MARLQFGQSRVQIAGTQVPIADFTLGVSDAIYFGHHSLLWTDATAGLTQMKLAGAWNRMRAGLPILMVQGTGPGHIALSGDKTGELVALPLAVGQQIWVREHRFLAASGNVTYDWQNSPVWFQTGSGDETEIHYPLGVVGDHFTAYGAPGLLFLHAPGNVFIRDLAAGETLLIQPGALLYRDTTVQANLHLEYPQSTGGLYNFFSKYSYRTVWLRLTGPGRVAVQSVYERPEANEAITSMSPGTRQQW